MKGITKEMLQSRVNWLNKITGHPEGGWVKVSEGKYNSVEGAYDLSGAYGGYKLVQYVGTAGGERDITYGYISKGQLYDLINAYISGIESILFKSKR